MQQIYRTVTTYRAIIVSIIMFLIGAFLLYLSELPVLNSLPSIQALLKDFGALFIASVAVAFLWDLFSRRAFLTELLATTRLADDIQSTGLIGISPRWHGEINWDRLFRSSNGIKIFFIYARTWRNTHRESLRRFARQNNTSANVVFPDYDDLQLMTQIGCSIQCPAEEVRNLILEAQNDFTEIFQAAGNGTHLSIWLVRAFPVYSYYCFDNSAIFTLYSLSPTKKEVPTFQVERGGSLYSYFEDDFNSLLDEAVQIGRKIYP